MRPPKVSILIPVYNRDEFIGECIQSALDQTYSDFEVIIVDNASTDKTWDICQQHAAKDKRIRIFCNDTNIGPVHNWLKCINESRGEFGKILFSDDLIFPQFLEHTLPYLEDSEVAFVSTVVIVGETPDKGTAGYIQAGHEHRLATNHYWNRLIDFAVPYSPGAGIFRMTDMRENLLTLIPTQTDHDFTKNGAGPDVLLYALTALKYKYVVMLPNQDVFFREHAESLTKCNFDNKVATGYYAAMAWFCKHKLGRHYWVRYIARTWLLNTVTTRKLTSIRKHCLTYEGNGSFIEVMSVSWGILMASLLIILKRLRRSVLNSQANST